MSTSLWRIWSPTSTHPQLYWNIVWSTYYVHICRSSDFLDDLRHLNFKQSFLWPDFFAKLALHINDGLTSQAERIAGLVITGPTRRYNAAETSKVMFQLEKLCRNLELNRGRVIKEKEILNLIISHLTECMKDSRTRSMLLGPPRILKKITEESYAQNISGERKEIVDRIVATLFQVTDLFHSSNNTGVTLKLAFFLTSQSLFTTF